MYIRKLLIYYLCIVGKVQRILQLPQNADVDKCTATFKDGVLTVSFPKTSSSQFRKQITIEQGN